MNQFYDRPNSSGFSTKNTRRRAMDRRSTYFYSYVVRTVVCKSQVVELVVTVVQVGRQKKRHKSNMPVRRRKNAADAAAAAPDGTDNSGTRSSANDDKHGKAAKKPTRQTAEEFRGMHLAPLPLVMMVLLCSGALWVLSFRDVMATGRSIAGGMDDAMLVSWLAARSIGLEISRYRYPARFRDVQCFLIDNDGPCI